MFGKRGQTAAIGGDIEIIQLRTARQRPFLPVLHRLICLAIDDDRGPDRLEQRQLLGDPIKLGPKVVVDQRAAVPARDKRQIMIGQHRSQRAGLPGKLATGLGADKSGFAGFGQADLERRIAAKLRQVVIRPGNGGHPETKFHTGIPFRIM